MAAYDTGKMILFVRSVLWDLGIPQEAATTLYEDNDACTAMGNAQKPTTRTRHMDIKVQVEYPQSISLSTYTATILIFYHLIYFYLLCIKGWLISNCDIFKKFPFFNHYKFFMLIKKKLIFMREHVNKSVFNDSLYSTFSYFWANESKKGR